MEDDRRCQIVLLDERRLDYQLQPEQSTDDLLTSIVQHLGIVEAEFFGLAFIDDTGQRQWLLKGRRVFDHDLPKKTILLYFLVKYFVESVSALRDGRCIEQFYLQAKSNVYKGVLETNVEQSVQLAALACQATIGDYIDGVSTRSAVSKLRVLPARLYHRKSPDCCISLDELELQVVAEHQRLSGINPTQAILSFMQIVELVPSYGIHFYEVKDKQGVKWWLGLSHRGISQYSQDDRQRPKKQFLWKQLQNLFFRDKKFSIEVHDPQRVVHTLSSFNLYEEAIREPREDLDQLSEAITDPTTQVSVSRRTFGPGNVTVYAWFADTPQLTKCIWSMAATQHQHHSQLQLMPAGGSSSSLPVIRSPLGLSEPPPALPPATSSASIATSGSTPSHSGSTTSLITPIEQMSEKEKEDNRLAQQHLKHGLLERKERLQLKLEAKLQLLRQLCLRESEITQRMPPEITQCLKPGETVPPIRRKVKTAYELPTDTVRSLGQHDSHEERLKELELDVEILRGIAAAAQTHASDRSISRAAKKERKKALLKTQERLRQLEAQVESARRFIKSRRAGSTPALATTRYDDNEGGFTTSNNYESSTHDQSRTLPRQRTNQQSKGRSVSKASSTHSLPQSTASSESRSQTPPPQQRPHPVDHPVQHPTHYQQTVGDEPPPPYSSLQHGSTSSLSDNSSGSRGYVPSSVYATRTQYRNRQYPTLSQTQLPGVDDLPPQSADYEYSVGGRDSPMQARYFSPGSEANHVITSNSSSGQVMHPHLAARRTVTSPGVTQVDHEDYPSYPPHRSQNRSPTRRPAAADRQRTAERHRSPRRTVRSPTYQTLDRSPTRRVAPSDRTESPTRRAARGFSPQYTAPESTHRSKSMDDALQGSPTSHPQARPRHDPSGEARRKFKDQHEPEGVRRQDEGLRQSGRRPNPQREAQERRAETHERRAETRDRRAEANERAEALRKPAQLQPYKLSQSSSSDRIARSMDSRGRGTDVVQGRPPQPRPSTRVQKSASHTHFPPPASAVPALPAAPSLNQALPLPSMLLPPNSAPALDTSSASIPFIDQTPVRKGGPTSSGRSTPNPLSSGALKVLQMYSQPWFDLEPSESLSPGASPAMNNTRDKSTDRLESSTVKLERSQVKIDLSQPTQYTAVSPSREESKPYETADFYKYSERLRHQRSSHTSPGAGSHGPSGHTPASHGAPGHTPASHGTSGHAPASHGASGHTSPSYTASTPSPSYQSTPSPTSSSYQVPKARSRDNGLSRYTMELNKSNQGTRRPWEAESQRVPQHRLKTGAEGGSRSFRETSNSYQQRYNDNYSSAGMPSPQHDLGSPSERYTSSAEIQVGFNSLPRPRDRKTHGSTGERGQHRETPGDRVRAAVASFNQKSVTRSAPGGPPGGGAGGGDSSSAVAADGSVAEGFSDEMLAWYDEREGSTQPATVV